MGIMIWIRGARLKTLPLAIAPVLIGASLAWRDAGERRAVRFRGIAVADRG